MKLSCAKLFLGSCASASYLCQSRTILFSQWQFIEWHDALNSELFYFILCNLSPTPKEMGLRVIRCTRTTVSFFTSQLTFLPVSVSNDFDCIMYWLLPCGWGLVRLSGVWPEHPFHRRSWLFRVSQTLWASRDAWSEIQANDTPRDSFSLRPESEVVGLSETETRSRKTVPPISRLFKPE
jgi:hypothetical protein